MSEFRMMKFEEPRGIEWQAGIGRLKGSKLRFNVNELNLMEIIPKNPFKVGERLEAIDPKHRSTFCVASVAEIRGSRLRIHLDGYSDLYDFWVNKRSWSIFPCGFCRRTGRLLSVPPEEDLNFNWSCYLRKIGATAASKISFSNVIVEPNTTVSIGERLEMKQYEPPFLWGPAAIIDVIGNRVLVHMDGSPDDSYDDWFPLDSPHIAAIGYCEEQNIPLSIVPPSFTSWPDYLKRENANPVRYLTMRTPLKIAEGSIFEVVDPFNRRLIRRAEVVKVETFTICLRFEGWNHANNDFWIDSDSEDIHPVGWCLENFHPLEPSGTFDSCQTPGCNGVGSTKGPLHFKHASLTFCPYSKTNTLRKVPRRFEWNRWSYPLEKSSRSKLRDAVHRSIFTNIDKEELKLSLALARAKQHMNIETWDCMQVAAQVTGLTGQKSIGDLFLKHQIDGTSLLCLKQEDLTETLKLKLGPTLKILSLVM